MTLDIIATAATKRISVKYIQIEMRGKYKNFTPIRNSINSIKDRLQEKKWRISEHMGKDNSHHQKSLQMQLCQTLKLHTAE